MTEHLPECPVEKRLRAGNTVSSQTCICAALRACEKRVFAIHPEWTVTGLCKPDCAACRRLTELITEWEYGYEKGLGAAREAKEEALNAAVQRIEALPWTSETWTAHAERAAIIAAIKGDQR